MMLPSRLLSATVLSIALGSPALAATPVDPASLDWPAIGQETAAVLSEYLKVDTVNPSGNELRGAQFLAEWFESQGIDSTIQEYAPGRANIWARVEGTSDAPAICLLSHIDVAEFEAERWSHPPLSGHIDAEGVVWGRGALDMKGMGAIEAMTLALLVREDVPLERDVVFLAVADEEVTNTGIQAAIERWDELGCSHVINEGGMLLRDALFDGQTLAPISVGEKGFLWAEVTATGEPGHGSVPVPDRAPERLVRAYEALEGRKVRPVWDDTILELLASVGHQQGGLTGFILQRPALVKLLVKGQLMDNELTRAVLTDTVNITGFSGAKEPNVVPGTVKANLDSRLLPATSPDQMRRYLNDIIEAAGVDGVEVVETSSMGGAVSEWRGDPLYDALVRRVTEGRPEVAAGPALSPGFTDSIYLRQLGVRAYGLVPFTVDEAGLRSMHGDDERVSTDNLQQGVRVLFSALLDVCQTPPK